MPSLRQILQTGPVYRPMIYSPPAKAGLFKRAAPWADGNHYAEPA
jgi:hypothetical protein